MPTPHRGSHSLQGSRRFYNRFASLIKGGVERSETERLTPYHTVTSHKKGHPKRVAFLLTYRYLFCIKAEFGGGGEGDAGFDEFYREVGAMKAVRVELGFQRYAPAVGNLGVAFARVAVFL